MNDRHLASFYIAGFNYYDGFEVYDKLQNGTLLLLRAEPENRFDPEAVAIYYQEMKLGFVPRSENTIIRKFLNLGYTDMFEVRICQIVPEANPERQIRVVVRIKENTKA
jgi:hypothetical protein